MARVFFTEDDLRQRNLRIRPAIPPADTFVAPQEKKGSRNKKIRGATRVVHEGIVFDSMLEKEVYVHLCRLRIPVQLKPVYELQEAYSYRGKTYQRMIHTPDFFIPALDLVIEAKGYCNDRYPLYVKMLRCKWAKEQKNTCLVFIRTTKQLVPFMQLLARAFIQPALVSELEDTYGHIPGHTRKRSLASSVVHY